MRPYHKEWKLPDFWFFQRISGLMCYCAMKICITLNISHYLYNNNNHIMVFWNVIPCSLVQRTEEEEEEEGEGRKRRCKLVLYNLSHHKTHSIRRNKYLSMVCIVLQPNVQSVEGFPVLCTLSWQELIYLTQQYLQNNHNL